MSLDGFIARSDGRIDWLAAVERVGEDFGFGRFFGSIDTLVVGKKTYQTALGFDSWPYSGKRCVVMTHSTLEARHGEEACAGEPRALVDRLTGEGAKRIYVDGGVVIRQFIEAGLVSDITISIVPVLLGAGVPLFGDIGGDVRLDLVESRAFESGLVQIEYRVIHS